MASIGWERISAQGMAAWGGGKMTNTVYTVGHSSRSFDEVVTMLRNNKVTHLVDVRSFPSSRKFPQWNQSAIIDALPSDIEYR